MVSGRSWVQLLVTELAVLIALTRAEVVSLEGTAPRLAILRPFLLINIHIIKFISFLYSFSSSCLTLHTRTLIHTHTCNTCKVAWLKNEKSAKQIFSARRSKR